VSEFLENSRLQLVLFGGKGGSGKTTSAAASALYLAEKNRDKKILVVSTDPAHSLGDSFGCKVGSKVTGIVGAKNLFAKEVNAQELLVDFKSKHEAVMKKIADRGTYFDGEDIEDFFSLSLPGLDEVMAVIEIANILKSGQFDLIILDTAPTGHTIRMLALPAQMEKWVKVFDLMQEKHRYMTRHFTGRYVKDDADQFLETLGEDIKKVKMLLTDSETTEFVSVTIPEYLSIEESARLLVTLREHNIPVRSIIVNRLVRVKEGCAFCSAKHKGQKSFLADINHRFADYHLFNIPLFPHEVQGAKNLREYAEILFEKSYPCEKRKASLSTPSVTSIGKVNLSDLLTKNLELILFGGKGGVGKTSIASATALRLAKESPDKKVLIFSTDPAHSLSDSFGCQIGDKVTQITGSNNLYALEIEAAKLYEDLKKKFKDDIEAAFEKFLSPGVDIKFDREVMTELISLAPPGLDELMALRKITEFMDQKQFDVYILDTAATGHLLRFLELPHIIREWLDTFFKLILKYRGVVRLTRATEELLALSKSIRKIQGILNNSKKCEFVAVTIPEAMGVAETEDLLLSINKLKIPCRHIAVNMVVPATKCSFCEVKHGEEEKYIKKINRKFSGHKIALVPLFPKEIKGLESLSELSKILYG